MSSIDCFVPDEDLIEMAKAAGVVVPENIRAIDINWSIEEVGTITFECLLTKELAEVFFAWMTSKRLKR